MILEPAERTFSYRCASGCSTRRTTCCPLVASVRDADGRQALMRIVAERAEKVELSYELRGSNDISDRTDAVFTCILYLLKIHN
jgi:hypothetical protein